MKKGILMTFIVATAMSPIWADVCSDIDRMYADQIARLLQETQMALSLTTDPAEQTALRASFEAQKASLEAERDSVKMSAGCTNTGGTTDPGTGTTDPGTGGTDPGTGGTTPDTGSTDPGTGGTDSGTVVTDPNPTDTCKALMDEVEHEARLRSTNGQGFSDAAKYVRSRKAEIQAACGNYGRGRSQVGGCKR